MSYLTAKAQCYIKCSFSADIVNCVDLVFEEKRFQVDCCIGKYTFEEKEKRKELGCNKLRQCLGDFSEGSISYGHLLNEVRRKGKPLLQYLEYYRNNILEIYRTHFPYLFHVSAVPDILTLAPSKGKENMYYNEVCDAVFATSNYNEALLYLGRACGNKMAVIDGVCFYEDKPYRAWNSNSVYLKKFATIYYLDAADFRPVIDFYISEENEIKLKFGHEWVCYNEIPICGTEKITVIPAKDLSAYQLYYGLRHVSLAPYVERYIKTYGLEDRELYLQKLLNHKILAFVDTAKGS